MLLNILLYLIFQVPTEIGRNHNNQLPLSDQPHQAMDEKRPQQKNKKL